MDHLFFDHLRSIFLFLNYTINIWQYSLKMVPPLESWQFESFLSSHYCYSTLTLRYCYSYGSPTRRVLRDGSYAPMRYNEYVGFGSRFLLIPMASSLLCFASLRTSFLQSSEPSLLFSNCLQKKSAFAGIRTFIPPSQFSKGEN